MSEEKEGKLEDAVFGGKVKSVKSLMKDPGLVHFVRHENDMGVWGVWAEHANGRADILDALLSGGPPHDWMNVVGAAIKNHSVDGLSALLERLPGAAADQVNSAWSVAARANEADRPETMKNLGQELQRLIKGSCAEAAAVIRVIEAAFPGSSGEALNNPDVLAMRIRAACVGDDAAPEDMADLLTNNVAETTIGAWANAFHQVMETHPQRTTIGFDLFGRRRDTQAITRLMAAVGCCPQAQEGWDYLWAHRASWSNKLDTAGVEALTTQEEIIAWFGAGNWGRGCNERQISDLPNSLKDCEALSKALGCPLGRVAHINSHVLNAQHCTQSLMDVVLGTAGHVLPGMLSMDNAEEELLASLNRPFILRYMCVRVGMLPYEQLMNTYPSLVSWRDDYGNTLTHHLAAQYHTGAKEIEDALCVRPELLLVRNNAGHTPGDVLKITGKSTPAMDRLCRLVQMADDQGVLDTATAAAGPHEPARAPKM